MNSLIAYLDTIYPMSDELKHHLLDIVKTANVPKKEYILKPGHVCQNIYFIQSGLIRHFHMEGKDEITSCFMQENDIAYSAVSFYTQSCSTEYIQALEHTEIHYISYGELQHIFDMFSEFHVISRKLTVHYHTLRDQQDIMRRLPLAEDRYKYILNNRPEIILRVPNKILASYLGCTDVYLSIIKRGLF